MYQIRAAGFRVPITRHHAARLEVEEIAARGNLPVAALARQPNLKVNGLGGGKAEVAAAEGHCPVGQFQAAQDGFRVAGEFVQGLPRQRRLDDLHQLHLLELVLAEDAARVLAVVAHLAAKARGVRHMAERQRGGVQDGVAHQVRHRRLGGGDEVVALVAGHGELLVLELRQLPGALQRRRVHEVGHIHLLVAVFLRVYVEHELRQRPVQARHRARHHDEARTGNFDGGFGVQRRAGEVHMVLGLEAERRPFAPGAKLHVVRFVRPERHRGVRQVGHRGEEGVELPLQGLEALPGRLQALSQIAHFGHQRRDVRAIRLGAADGLRAGVAFPLQRFGLFLQAAPLGFQRGEPLQVEIVVSRLEGVAHGGRVAAQVVAIEHVRPP